MTTPGIMSSAARTSTSTAPTREVTRTVAPSVEAARRQVVGVHQQLVARPAPGEPLGVVHPGVAVRWWRRPMSSSSSRGPADGLAQPAPGRPPPAPGARSIRLSVVCSRSGSGRRGAGRGRRPPGCARSSRIVDAGRPRRSSRSTSRVGLAVSRARCASRSLQPAPRGPGAPLVRRASSRKISQSCARRPACAKHRRGEPGGVAHRERVEDQVVVVALQRGRRRQDHVRVPGGLVEVDVDRGHEVEAGERPVEPCAVRRGEHRVAGDGQHRPDLPVAGGLDLLAQRRRRAARRANSGSPRTRLRQTSWWPRPMSRGPTDVDRRAR